MGESLNFNTVTTDNAAKIIILNTISVFLEPPRLLQRFLY